MGFCNPDSLLSRWDVTSCAVQKSTKEYKAIVREIVLPWYNIQKPVIMAPGNWIAKRYSNGGLNTSPLNKWWSEHRIAIIPGIWISNTPTIEQIPHDLNSKLVRYSDPHCTREKGRFTFLFCDEHYKIFDFWGTRPMCQKCKKICELTLTHDVTIEGAFI